MKYIVITTKHHDGFCMFDSKLTDYDIIDATPFKRDPMKELAAACRRQGISSASTTRSWTGTTRTTCRAGLGHADRRPTRRLDRYVELHEGRSSRSC